MRVHWEAETATDDRGLAYGDGCFETLRLTPGGAPLWPWHRARLLGGAARLGIPLAEAVLDEALTQALARCHGSAVLKLILTRGSGGRGYAAPQAVAPRLLASLHPLPARPHSDYHEGIVTGLCQQRLATAPALAGLKHLNRLEQVLARQEVQRAGWAEGLMLDEHGRPVEFTSMNLFARFGDQLWTPPLAQAGVAGVARAVIIEQLAPAAGLFISQQLRPLSQLRQADEVFACNSVAGILPVRTLALWRWPVGPVTLALQARLADLFA